MSPTNLFPGLLPGCRRGKSTTEPAADKGAALRTAEGELLELSVAVELRSLEAVLDTLDCLPFPVNPQVVHGERPASPISTAETVVVQFPAYDRRLADVVGLLEHAGIAQGQMTVRPV
jgi:hypothetical protein